MQWFRDKTGKKTKRETHTASFSTTAPVSSPDVDHPIEGASAWSTVIYHIIRYARLRSVDHRPTALRPPSNFIGWTVQPTWTVVREEKLIIHDALHGAGYGADLSLHGMARRRRRSVVCLSSTFCGLLAKTLSLSYKKHRQCQDKLYIG